MYSRLIETVLYKHKNIKENLQKKIKLFNTDDFVEMLDEKKKRKKKRKKKSKSRKKSGPNAYQRTMYKADPKTTRGRRMGRIAAKVARGEKLTKADYAGRERDEEKQRKSKGYKTKPRHDTGMYISESMKRKLDAYVEMLHEKKKRKKKKKKKKKSAAGKLSAATKETLRKKAKRRGLTPSSVYAEYRKGLAAWATSGSRKGMSQHQWAHARVNSANPSKSWAVVKKAKGGKKK